MQMQVIAKLPISNVKCRHVNKNNKLNCKQLTQAMAESLVSTLRDTGDLAIACIHCISCKNIYVYLRLIEITCKQRELVKQILQLCDLN